MSLHLLSSLASAQREIVLVENSKPRRQYIKKSPRWAKPVIPRKCTRCGTLETPQWRKVKGLVFCNACGCVTILQFELRKIHRASSLKGGRPPSPPPVKPTVSEPAHWVPWPAVQTPPTPPSTAAAAPQQDTSSSRGRMAIDFLLNPTSHAT